MPLVYTRSAPEVKSYPVAPPRGRSLTGAEAPQYLVLIMSSLQAGTIFAFLGVRVTNTLLATLVVDCVILLLISAARRGRPDSPGAFQGAVEVLVEYVMNATEQIAGPRARMIFPWAAVFFIYIAVSNLTGLLPGFGTMGFFRSGGLVPILQSNTSDLNTTLALAVVSVIATHVMAIRSNGILEYLKRFFTLNPLFLVVGVLEIVPELTKFISFSFRLFGNVSAGELVLGTMSSLAAFIVPVPFLALEILVGLVQAMIFALLTMTFMAILTEPRHGEGGI
jgi:F-type H+-transporting ATPase subunit a